jgi:hypothetical protein
MLIERLVQGGSEVLFVDLELCLDDGNQVVRDRHLCRLLSVEDTKTYGVLSYLGWRVEVDGEGGG